MSAPFNVFNRNMGHEEAFILNPEDGYRKNVKKEYIETRKMTGFVSTQYSFVLKHDKGPSYGMFVFHKTL